MEKTPLVQITADHIQIDLPEKDRLTLPRLHLPETFMQWQSEARLHMFDALKSQGAEAMKRQPAHLPVLATSNKGLFPVNLATRGLGVLPRPEQLESLTHLFEETRRSTEGRPWPETLSQRVEVVQDFYSNPNNFDPRVLGGLEIFEGQTPQNLQRYPMASLLFTGEAPRFPSYQFNGVVVFVEPENPAYRFLRAARELFAFDAFHIHQIRYPCGYLFHVVEVRDKTPYPGR
ncbi:MAG: hypothetical protein JXA25_00435 [Anaerolineales bacterium]|nr:hypothetical protein [Anaerolineales bacterium]